MDLSVAVDHRSYVQSIQTLTDSLLDQYIPSDRAEPTLLHKAMRYSVLAGGKRMRPVLAKAAYDYCGGQEATAPDSIHKAMAGLEMVHTYSLIHDDLPCMDDDDLRRGIPTCHKKFGDAVATLAGDALHVIAFQLMAETGSPQVVLELAQAVGTSGMLGGQMADIEAEGKEITADEVRNIHVKKTGALIRGAVRIGALLAEAPTETLNRLTEYGEKTGLAFQIIDDVLDIEGDQKLLGKSPGSDSKNHKATYPGVIGVEAARKEANRLIDEALSVFNDEDDSSLQYLARYIGQREH